MTQPPSSINPSSTSPISVLILTKNEAQDLPECLRSVAWSDDVHVFDSFSTDDTTEIARAWGAQVTQRAFDGYAAQRNAALRGIAYKHPWLLILDADERVPAASAEAMARFVRDAPAGIEACRLRRRDFFGKTWLAHAQISPYYIRLVRPEKVHYEREINEVMQVDGGIHDLDAPFDHYPFSKGIAHWLDKHNQYSSMEARHIVQARREGAPFSVAQAFLAKDFNQRRFHQKELFYRLPARPLLKWLYMVLVRRAFLDKQAGLTYAYLQAVYEYLIVVKTREIEQGWQEASHPDSSEQSASSSGSPSGSP